MADVYVKLDDVINIIKEVNWNLGGLIQHLKEHCPTDDVVPKSEWDRIYNELESLKSGTLPRLIIDLRIANTNAANLEMEKAELVKGIFADIESDIEKLVQDARNCQEEYQSPAAKPFITLCEGKLSGLGEAKQVISELKKKYT